MRKLQRILLALLIVVAWASCSRKDVDFKQSNLTQILEYFHDTSSSEVLVVAHRASNAQYPENSLAAIQYSINTGVDVVELDIRTTRDGKLVLMHDETVDRTTSGEGKVRELTYKELEVLSLESNWGDTIVHRIPLVEEAFLMAKGYIMIDLDIKDVSIRKLVELVQKTGVQNQVLFFDSSFEVLDSVRLLDSTLLLMPRAHSLEEAKSIIERYHPPVIHIDDDFYTDEVVQTIKESGARVWINALGVPDIKAKIGIKQSGYGKLIEKGANIIQTDYPVLLEEFLLKREE